MSTDPIRPVSHEPADFEAGFDALVEPMARAICQSRKFECGDGACSLLCLDQLGDARGGPHGCDHAARVHGDLARAALTAITPMLQEMLAQAQKDALEEAARYHDDMADEAMASWEAARERGVEFSNRGQDIAIEHRRHATAIRSLKP